ncbi:MAG: hypothetical protein AMJ54_14610 [Deltaproteobacteria bacterium SG8_13]|nr:MAG: hypothetical protein AMJ54_14610 [Deltaproteobacteria bacterium SG8_13]
MKKTDLYSHAHAFIAGIRVCEFRKAGQPTVDDVCNLLSMSTEQGHHICNKLAELDVIECVEGAFGIRVFIRDHLKLEEIPRGETGSSMEDELKKFQDSKKEFSKKIESIQAAQAEKKKSLFAEVEKKLKEQMDKNKS